LKTSLIENTQELKQVLLVLEKKIYEKAIRWAREEFKRILEQTDVLIQQHRPFALRIVHKRSTWYRTWAGADQGNQKAVSGSR
jgi:hypothetical protein